MSVLQCCTVLYGSHPVGSRRTVPESITRLQRAAPLHFNETQKTPECDCTNTYTVIATTAGISDVSFRTHQKDVLPLLHYQQQCVWIRIERHSQNVYGRADDVRSDASAADWDGTYAITSSGRAHITHERTLVVWAHEVSLRDSSRETDGYNKVLKGHLL